MTAQASLRARQQERSARVHERLDRSRKPSPPTRDDIERLVLSAAKMPIPQLAVQMRIPRSSRPKAGARVRLFGRTGPQSGLGRAVDWEPAGAVSAWWSLEDLAALLVPREPTRSELEQFIADLRVVRSIDADTLGAAACNIMDGLDRKLSAWGEP